MESQMNAIDAAYQVLREIGRPLHYKEIARRIIDKQLWQPSGHSPEASINTAINREIADKGTDARFARLGQGEYAAVKHESGTVDDLAAIPDEAFIIAESWKYLTPRDREKIMQIVRAGMDTRLTGPLAGHMRRHGEKRFPDDFLDSDAEMGSEFELPADELSVRCRADGSWIAESHFGFSYEVRNRPEGMFILHAHARGLRRVSLPKKMLHVFKAVKQYEEYLRILWRDLYQTSGRKHGDRTAAYRYAKAAFDTLGLPVPAEEPTSTVAENDELGVRKRKGGARTHETAFYVPILQAVDEMGGSGKAADVVKRVGEIMAGSFLPEDHEPLQSTGLPRWDSNLRFARYSMVRKGLLKAGSPRGIWEISNKGNEHLRRSQNS